MKNHEKVLELHDLMKKYRIGKECEISSSIAKDNGFLRSKQLPFQEKGRLMTGEHESDVVIDFVSGIEANLEAGIVDVLHKAAVDIF